MGAERLADRLSWAPMSGARPNRGLMCEGLEIDYRIVIRGLPIPWRSRIDVWAEGVRFVDRQLVGPYRWWRHEHRFEPTPGGWTRIIDHVEFVPRLRWVTGRLVQRDVRRIFAFRGQALARLFGLPDATPAARRTV